MDSKGYYKTLGVPENASQDDIKKAFRKLSMQWHDFCNIKSMKRFLLIIFVIFASYNLYAQTNVVRVGWGGTYYCGNDTLILARGIYHGVSVRKVNTGYYIGDDPVKKDQRTYYSNSEEFIKWFKGKKYKTLEVYCNLSEEFSDSHQSKSGESDYVVYETPDKIKHILENYSSELTDYNLHAYERFSADSIVIIKKALTDSLLIKFIGVPMRNHAMIIVGKKGGLIWKNLTLRDGIFNPPLTTNKKKMFGEEYYFSSSCDKVLASVEDKTQEIVLRFNTVRSGVNMKKYRENFEISLKNAISNLKSIGFESVKPLLDNTLYDGQIVVQYRDYE